MINSSESVRPSSWADFSGQPQVVKSLKIAISAAKSREEPMEHTLLYGPPGLGKTTLAHIIANEMGVNLKITSGPALTRAGDLASILTALEPGDVLFIDEIHRLSKTVEEALYPAMEDCAIDIILGKGPAAKNLRLDLNPFTLVGATTQAGKISSPLRDRFGIVHRLRFYIPEELQGIIQNAAQKLKLKLDNDSALEIAKRSRGTARIALKLLRRVRDYTQVENDSVTSPTNIKVSLDFYQVDEEGLDETDRRLLRAIIEQHRGGPVGLETLAALISESVDTITDLYEPYLLQSGFLSKTSKGRVATTKAYDHLGIKGTV
ncbi:MAG: Holliday junction ATP-dependent DNA helicase RuvB [Candidatus Collierbacteria bacterium GW2011_GWB1_44_6]|uniref:Holliday junction branch migration complex subunit RuvB n=2 Tax=Candidatus Collieribacteriota TaxID=1752725 RepID=A0A0G1JQ39_9BACT|nr:MAG: Holliday junction ATP-dependent DNA helicase RuvB [Candidatus Collierbacteria bacterium GW2011_GWC2_43_12]KKT32289.1 MAG: Holliday junction ATP-dependent DNA helicase RuvB [Candidatus Moranbacteria bacterium GW2011_GWF2_44_10]KKT73478.1 MAG: Holliday junction ATP-dependent DNA helicase RuvB [Candidatus Collierbacteria bacterium GW2011_GWB1_44_6]KKT83858.1 MAG: Holliday junction ATP-dependent DNA helicase RuvB [Microgenomates group bacterium GW2011_GWC1_44_9]